MDKILCHIVGLNDELKKKIINLLNKDNFNIEFIDLDFITNKIINDKYMNMMYNKYESIYEKSKEKGSDKTLAFKYKEIEKKMNQYWKSKFEIMLKRECQKSKKQNIILLGLNVHFKNSKISLKINCKLLLFARVNLIDNAKKIIENNLDNHRDEIIAGSFPLQYLDSNFLIKKRQALQNNFKKLGYETKSITSIIMIIINNLNNKIINIPDLYFASYEKLDKKIKKTNDRIIAYSIPWLSIMALNKNFKKGYQKNKAFIKQIGSGENNDLQKKCFLYQIDKNNFYYHENSNNIKFASSIDSKIINTYIIDNISNYLTDNGIKIIF